MLLYLCSCAAFTFCLTALGFLWNKGSFICILSHSLLLNKTLFYLCSFHPPFSLSSSPSTLATAFLKDRQIPPFTHSALRWSIALLNLKKEKIKKLVERTDSFFLFWLNASQPLYLLWPLRTQEQTCQTNLCFCLHVMSATLWYTLGTLTFIFLHRNIGWLWELITSLSNWFY